MTPPAITSGNHPPWMILMELAARNAPSKDEKQSGQLSPLSAATNPRTERAAEKNKMEVIVMVREMAMP